MKAQALPLGCTLHAQLDHSDYPKDKPVRTTGPTPWFLLLQFLKARYCGSPVPGWMGLQQEWSSGLTETSDRVSLA